MENQHEILGARGDRPELSFVASRALAEQTFV